MDSTSTTVMCPECGTSGYVCPQCTPGAVHCEGCGEWIAPEDSDEHFGPGGCPAE